MAFYYRLVFFHGDFFCTSHWFRGRAKMRAAIVALGASPILNEARVEWSETHVPHPTEPTFYTLDDFMQEN